MAKKTQSNLQEWDLSYIRRSLRIRRLLLRPFDRLCPRFARLALRRLSRHAFVLHSLRAIVQLEDIFLRKRQAIASACALILIAIPFQNCTPIAPINCQGSDCKGTSGSNSQSRSGSGSSGSGSMSGGANTLASGGFYSGSSGQTGGSSGGSSGSVYGGSSSSSGSGWGSSVPSSGTFSSAGAPQFGGSSVAPTIAPTNAATNAAENQKGLRILTEPWDLTTEEGSSATLAIFAVAGDGSSDQLPSIQWYRNNMPLRGETKNILRILHATPEHEGIYHAVVTSQTGATLRSQNATIRVRPGRAPCSAGDYGRPPYSKSSDLVPAEQYGYDPDLKRHTFNASTPDAYFLSVPTCLLPGSEGWSGATTLQCQNGKFVIISQSCTRPCQDEPGCLADQ